MHQTRRRCGQSIILTLRVSVLRRGAQAWSAYPPILSVNADIPLSRLVPLADFVPRRRLNLSLCITAKWPADVRGGSIALDRQDRDARPMSASPPIAVKHWRRSETPLCARSRRWSVYSITSSAVASSLSGTVRPSALAVLRLITSSNLVGAWTGRSLGLAPLRIRSTYCAARR